MFYGSDNEMSDNEFCIDDNDNYENDSEYDEPKSYKVLLLLYN